MGDDPFSPSTKPAFLDPKRASEMTYVGGEPPVEVRFDHELEAENDPAFVEAHPGGKGPSPGYKERWRAIARLNALGYTNNDIGKRLNYSPTAVSLALKSEWVQAEVRRYREQYDFDIASKVKEAAMDGADFIHSIIRDERAKNSERLDASKWAVEKTTGKAKQEHSVESGTLAAFTELLRDMQAKGEVIDVTPNPLVPALASGNHGNPSNHGNSEARSAEGCQSGTSAPGTDKWSNWLDSNL